jgi:NADP-dependent 3-hydroxy acid dehydrogenase YdfG
MIDINVKGLLYVLKPSSQMIERKSGHIINIGSTAAKKKYPNGNYCATKHAVDFKSGANGFKPFGIRVVPIPEWCKLN